MEKQESNIFGKKIVLSRATATVFLFLHENIYVVGTHLKCLIEALLMSTHKIYFSWRNKKNIYLDTTFIWSYVYSQNIQPLPYWKSHTYL